MAGSSSRPPLSSLCLPLRSPACADVGLGTYPSCASPLDASTSLSATYASTLPNQPLASTRFYIITWAPNNGPQCYAFGSHTRQASPKRIYLLSFSAASRKIFWIDDHTVLGDWAASRPVQI